MELLQFVTENAPALAKLLQDGGFSLTAVGMAFLYFQIKDVKKIVTNGLTHRVEETHENVINLRAQINAIEKYGVKSKDNA